MSKTTAHWYLELLVVCPDCKHLFDLTEEDDFWANYKPTENRTDNSRDVEVECTNCGYQFKVDFEY